MVFKTDVIVQTGYTLQIYTNFGITQAMMQQLWDNVSPTVCAQSQDAKTMHSLIARGLIVPICIGCWSGGRYFTRYYLLVWRDVYKCIPPSSGSDSENRYKSFVCFQKRFLRNFLMGSVLNNANVQFRRGRIERKALPDDVSRALGACLLDHISNSMCCQLCSCDACQFENGSDVTPQPVAFFSQRELHDFGLCRLGSGNTFLCTRSVGDDLMERIKSLNNAVLGSHADGYFYHCERRSFEASSNLILRCGLSSLKYQPYISLDVPTQRIDENWTLSQYVEPVAPAAPVAWVPDNSNGDANFLPTTNDAPYYAPQQQVFTPATDVDMSMVGDGDTL